jgi:hypothetical protein
MSVAGCPAPCHRAGGARRRPAKLVGCPAWPQSSYAVIGVIVASQHAYYAHLGNFSQVLSAVVATGLWPLVLLGADLHLSLANL